MCVYVFREKGITQQYNENERATTVHTLYNLFIQYIFAMMP